MSGDSARGRWQEAFQIADDVKHQKAEENQSGDGDYRLLTKGTTVETGEAAHWDTRYSRRFASIGGECVEFLAAWKPFLLGGSPRCRT